METNTEILAVAEGGRRILLDRDTNQVIVDGTDTASRVVIDLSNNQITLVSPGDIEVKAGGKLRLSGEEGVELVSRSETIIQGSMVRIN